MLLQISQHLVMIKSRHIKLIVLYLTFIYANYSYSQDLEKLNKHNTIFIYYEGLKDAQSKRALAHPKEKPHEKPYLYKFYFYDLITNKLNKKHPIQLYFHVYRNIPKKKAPIMYSVHKSFLKKNKDIILTKDFMCKIGREKTRQLLKNAKVIFLIDKQEIKHKKVLIKQVVFNDMLII